MQIKSWQIALIQFIIQIISLSYSYTVLSPCGGDSGRCGMPGFLELIFLILFLFAGATLLAVLLFEITKTQKVAAILSIFLGIVWITFYHSVQADQYFGISNVFIVAILGFLQGVFLLIAGLYYFWKNF